MRVEAEKLNPSTGINYFISGSQSPNPLDYCLDATDSPNIINLSTQIIGSEGFASVTLSFWQSTLSLVPNAYSDFTFNFNGSTYTTSDDPEKLQFFSWETDITSRILSAQSLADQINSDLNVNWAYTANVIIGTNSVFVTLRAKNSGTIFDPFLNFSIFSGGVELNRNNFTSSYMKGNDFCIGQKLQKYGYSVFLELWKVNETWGRRGNVNSQTAELITTLETSWNKTNLASFDLSSYLRPFTDVPIPLYKASLGFFLTLPTAIQAYFYRWGEKFSGGYNKFGLDQTNPVLEGLKITLPSANQFKVESGSFEYNGQTYFVNVDSYFPIPQNQPFPYYITVFVELDGTVDYIYGDQSNDPEPSNNPINTRLLGFIFVGTDSFPTVNYPYGPAQSNDSITNTYVRKYYTGESEIQWAARGAFTGNWNPTNFFRYWQTVRLDDSETNIYPKVPFLTNQPQNKMRRRMIDTEYLYFYHLNDQQYGPAHSFRVASVFTLIDGTEFPTTYSHLTNSVSHSGLLYVDMNLAFLNFFQISQIQQILDSRHWVEKFQNGQWSQVTEEMTYVYDLNASKDNVTLVWRNPFGCFDSFQFDGVQIQNLQTDPVLYTQTITKTSGWLPSQKYKGVFDANPKVELVLNSGWVNLDHNQWFQELLSSTDVLIPEKYVQNWFVGSPFNYWAELTSDQLTQVTIKNYNWQSDSISKYFNLELTLEVSLPINSITD